MVGPRRIAPPTAGTELRLWRTVLDLDENPADCRDAGQPPHRPGEKIGLIVPAQSMTSPVQGYTEHRVRARELLRSKGALEGQPSQW